MGHHEPAICCIGVGICYLMLENYQEAASLFTIASDHDQTDPRIWLLRAKAHSVRVPCRRSPGAACQRSFPHNTTRTTAP
eukprot:SAG22_NODE_999_length_6100_cov_9.934844_3_plen_80_part_00